MEKQTKPKSKQTETVTWENCLFVGYEWEKCDRYGNPFYTAFFLAHGEIFHRFIYIGYGEPRNTVESLKPLTPCTLTFHWYRGKKRLEAVTIEGVKNEQ